MNASRALVAGLALALAVSASAQAESIRILVGFAPGGTSDVIARLVAERLKTSMGAPVVVENRPGATGFIAAEALKNAAPDGRTLLVSPSSVTIFAPLTYTKLRYDPVRDFAPISLAATAAFVLVVGLGTPARTLQEYLALVHASPSNGAYGVPGAGGQAHLLGLMLARAGGVGLTSVPYKGGAPLATDLLGGQVPAGITAISDIVKYHQAGKVRILASSGSGRSTAAPDVPTFKELGFGTLEGSGFQSFHTTARTSRATVAQLAAAIASAIKASEVSGRLLELGMEPVGSTPDELARHEAEETSKWAPIVKASGFRANE